MTSTGPLKLYTDPTWRRQGIHTPLLNPWWGNPYGEEAVFSKQMFDSYSFDTSQYTITYDVKAAEMLLLPYPHHWFLRHDKELFNECVRIAQEFNLPVLLDGLGDIEHPVDIENVFILRYGGYSFLPDPRRVSMPLTVDDLLVRCRGGKLDIKKKETGKPVIGFAGWVNISPKQYLRTIIKELPVRLHAVFDDRYLSCIKGVLWRKKSIEILQKSSKVILNLRARSSFSASPKTAEGDMKNLQAEMVDTILQSDYALDVRGDANNSARLFEILSLGRIPIIVNTERNLPFSDRVDYSSFAFIIDFRDLDSLSERIVEFHESISPERFEEMQRNARHAFVNYFRIDAIAQHLVEDLRSKIASKAVPYSNLNLGRLRFTTRISKFIATGLVGISINLGMFHLLFTLGIPYLNGSVVSFVIAMFVGFILQKYWTFRESTFKRIRKQFVFYALLALCNLVVNTLIVYLFVEYVNINHLIAQIIGAGLVAAVSYFIYSLYIFSHGR